MQRFHRFFSGLLRGKTRPFMPVFFLRIHSLFQITFGLDKPIFRSFGHGAFPGINTYKFQ
jgi:hypothetical protein